MTFYFFSESNFNHNIKHLFLRLPNVGLKIQKWHYHLHNTHCFISLKKVVIRKQYASIPLLSFTLFLIIITIKCIVNIQTECARTEPETLILLDFYLCVCGLVILHQVHVHSLRCYNFQSHMGAILSHWKVSRTKLHTCLAHSNMI